MCKVHVNWRKVIFAIKMFLGCLLDLLICVLGHIFFKMFFFSPLFRGQIPIFLSSHFYFSLSGRISPRTGAIAGYLSAENVPRDLFLESSVSKILDNDTDMCR